MWDYDGRKDQGGGGEEEMLAQNDAKSTKRGNTNVYMEGNDDNNGDGNGHGGERLSRIRKTSDSSPFTSSWRNGSSSGVPLPPPNPVATSSSSHHTQKNVKRKPTIRVRQMAVATANTKKVMAKGKQKVQGSNKRKRKQGDDSGDQEYNDDYEVDEVNVDETDEEGEARFSSDYEGYQQEEQPVRGKQGRGGEGGDGSKTRDKDKDKDKDVAKNAKFEGISSVSTAGTRRSRTRKSPGEDTVVDVVDETDILDPLNTGSPTAANEGGEDDAPASSALPMKKRKLPTIKKLKSTASLGGAGPSTPSSMTVTGSKLAPPPPGCATGNKHTEVSKARPKANATSDLDLSNPSLYAELFKNVSLLDRLLLNLRGTRLAWWECLSDGFEQTR